VELWKDVVVLHCLASSVGAYVIHDPMAYEYHDLWVKMQNHCRV
jgi:hypothetical protein